MKKIRAEAEQTISIILAGLSIQLIELLVLKFYPTLSGTRVLFARGLWSGVAAAVILGIYMSHSIERALEMEEEEADRYMKRVYRIRLAGIIAAAALAYYFKPGYVMAAFLGLMCLKLGDFFRYTVHWIFEKCSDKQQNERG